MNHSHIVNVPILQLHQLRIRRFLTQRRFLHRVHFLLLTLRFHSNEKTPKLRVESPQKLLVHLQHDLLEGNQAAIHVETVLLVRVPLAADVQKRTLVAEERKAARRARVAALFLLLLRGVHELRGFLLLFGEIVEDLAARLARRRAQSREIHVRWIGFR